MDPLAVEGGLAVLGLVALVLLILVPVAILRVWHWTREMAADIKAIRTIVEKQGALTP